MDKVKEVRARIAELLSDELGVLGDGTPAVYVEPPDSPVGVGLHCFIARESEKMPGHRRKWVLDLVVYPSKDGDVSAIERSNSGYLINTDNALKKLRYNFPVNTEARIPYETGELYRVNFGIIFEVY